MIDTIARYWNEHIHDLEMTEARGRHARILRRSRRLSLRQAALSAADRRLRRVRGQAAARGRLRHRHRSAALRARRRARHGRRPVRRRQSIWPRRTSSLHGLQGTADLRVANGEALPFPGCHLRRRLRPRRRPVHVRSRSASFAEAWRVLKPGGRGIFMVYNRISWLNAMSMVMGVGLEHEDAPVLRKYSIGEFRALLEAVRARCVIVPERFPGEVAAAWRHERVAVQHGLRRLVQRRASSTGPTIRLASHGAVSKVNARPAWLGSAPLPSFGPGSAAANSRQSASRAQRDGCREHVGSSDARRHGGAPPTVPPPCRRSRPGLSGTLVFQSDREGRPKIYTLDLAVGTCHGADDRSAVPATRIPRWSPDGRQILFKSNRAHYGASPETGQPDFDLYVMQADGSGVRRLTKAPANENEATWMPDGRSIVFSSDQDSRGDLYRLWLDDGRVERLTRHFVGRAIMPTVSSDGTRVAFRGAVAAAGASSGSIRSISSMSPRARRMALAGSGGSCWPAWAPGGGRLAYVLLDTRAHRPRGGRRGQRRTAASRRRRQALELLPRLVTRRAVDRLLRQSGRTIKARTGTSRSYRRTARDGSRDLTTGAGNDRLPDWRP